MVMVCRRLAWRVWQGMLHRMGFGSIGFTRYVNLNGDNFDILAKGYCNTHTIVAQFFAPQEAGAPIDTGMVVSAAYRQAIVFLLSEESSQISRVNLPVGPGAP